MKGGKESKLYQVLLLVCRIFKTLPNDINASDYKGRK